MGKVLGAIGNGMGIGRGQFIEASYWAMDIDKPIVVSLAGDVEVEEASEYLFDHRIPAYPYSTEIPVDVLGAKYKWARGAGLL